MQQTVLIPTHQLPKSQNFELGSHLICVFSTTYATLILSGRPKKTAISTSYHAKVMALKVAKKMFERRPTAKASNNMNFIETEPTHKLKVTMTLILAIAI